MQKTEFLFIGTGRRSRSRRRGQALVEFAIIVVVFLAMLVGMLQFGVYQSTTNTLWNLSREGARFASVGQPTTAAIQNYVKSVAPPNIDTRATKLTISVSPDDAAPPQIRPSGQPVRVTIKYDLTDKIFFPPVAMLFRGQRVDNTDPKNPRTLYEYSTSSTMRVE